MGSEQDTGDGIVTAIERSGGFRSQRFLSREYAASADMKEFADAFLWTLSSERTADPARDVKRRIKWEVSPGVHVTYLEDPAVQSSYSIVTSTVGAPPVETVAAVLEAAPHVVSPDDLIAAVDSAVGIDDKSIAVVRAGLGAPTVVDDRFVRKIGAAAEDESAEIREAAVWAMTFSEWPTFRPLLVQIGRDDQESHLRRLAAMATEVFNNMDLGS